MKNINIFKGLINRHFHTGGVKPVYRGYYEHIDKITVKPHSWRTLEIVQKSSGHRGRLYTSLRLTYLFRALELLRDRADGSAKIYAATVNLDQCRVAALNMAIKADAGVSFAHKYCKQVNQRLERRKIHMEYIAVIELGKQRKPHVHLAFLCSEEDLENIIACLKMDAKKSKSGVQVKSTYERYFRPANQTESELEELDREYGLSNFPLEKITAAGKVYFSVQPIDAGWMDYLTKEVSKDMDLFNGRKFYCSRSVAQLAKNEYEARRTELKSSYRVASGKDQ